MSTKTSIKRIAAVAAVALTLGGFSAVSANAALATTSAVVTAGSTTLYTPVGVEVTTPVSLTTATDETAAGAIVITPTVTKPTASSLAVGTAGSAKAGLKTLINAGNVVTSTTAAKWYNTLSSGVETLTYVSGTIPALTTATQVSTLSVTPDAPGTYVVTLTPSGVAGTATATPVTVTIVAQPLTFTRGDGTPASPYTAGNGVAGTANSVQVTAVASQATGVHALVTVSGAGATIVSRDANATIATGGASAVIDSATSSVLNINTPTVGTVVVNIYNETGNGTGIYSSTAAGTVTITVNAAALNNVYSAAKAYAYTGSTATATNVTSTTSDAFTTDGLVAAAGGTATTAVATFKVTQYDSNSAELTANCKSVSVSSTIGSVSIKASQASAPIGSYASVASSTTCADGNPVLAYLFPDGRSGVATVTLSVNGVAVGTFTATFYSTTIAKMTVTAYKPALGADLGAVGSSIQTSSTATSVNPGVFVGKSAIKIAATDASGNSIGGSSLGVSITSSNPAVATRKSKD